MVVIETMREKYKLFSFKLKSLLKHTRVNFKSGFLCLHTSLILSTVQQSGTKFTS